jgi:hypothetical protein
MGWGIGGDWMSVVRRMGISGRSLPVGPMTRPGGMLVAEMGPLGTYWPGVTGDTGERGERAPADAGSAVRG